MRKSFFPGTTGIFALFFVPYIVTIIFNGANTTLINRKFNVEEATAGDRYQSDKLKTVMNWRL